MEEVNELVYDQSSIQRRLLRLERVIPKPTQGSLWFRVIGDMFYNG